MGKAKDIIGVVVGAAILFATLISACGGTKAIEGKKCLAPTELFSPSHTSRLEVNPPGEIGQEVRDGKFAFVVTGIEACQGDPIKVAMKVTNTANEPWSFLPGVQELLRNPSHPTGQIPTGGWACTECMGDGQSLYINAGDSINTVVSFDVTNEEPVIDALELHDALLSGGVHVYP